MFFGHQNSWRSWSNCAAGKLKKLWISRNSRARTWAISARPEYTRLWDTDLAKSWWCDIKGGNDSKPYDPKRPPFRGGLWWNIFLAVGTYTHRLCHFYMVEHFLSSLQFFSKPKQKVDPLDPGWKGSPVYLFVRGNNLRFDILDRTPLIHLTKINRALLHSCHSLQ